jgi:hypothetical protein
VLRVGKRDMLRMGKKGRVKDGEIGGELRVGSVKGEEKGGGSRMGKRGRVKDGDELWVGK